MDYDYCSEGNRLSAVDPTDSGCHREIYHHTHHHHPVCEPVERHESLEERQVRILTQNRGHLFNLLARESCTPDGGITYEGAQRVWNRITSGDYGRLSLEERDVVGDLVGEWPNVPGLTDTTIFSSSHGGEITLGSLSNCPGFRQVLDQESAYRPFVRPEPASCPEPAPCPEPLPYPEPAESCQPPLERSAYYPQQLQYQGWGGAEACSNFPPSYSDWGSNYFTPQYNYTPNYAGQFYPNYYPNSYPNYGLNNAMFMPSMTSMYGGRNGIAFNNINGGMYNSSDDPLTWIDTALTGTVGILGALNGGRYGWGGGWGGGYNGFNGFGHRPHRFFI